LVTPDIFGASATPTAATHSPTLLYNTATGALSIDYDGSGAAAPEQFAILSGHPTLAASDFVLLS
jgi:Ca2+-binding RTX toxin-like protein